MDIVLALDGRNLNQIIKCVLSGLDDVSLSRASVVSTAWRGIVKDSNVWKERYDRLINDDFYTSCIAANRQQKPKRMRLSQFNIEPFRKYWILKNLLRQVYDKSGSYEVRKLKHSPKTFANRITSFVTCAEFIATANMNGEVQVEFSVIVNCSRTNDAFSDLESRIFQSFWRFIKLLA